MVTKSRGGKQGEKIFQDMVLFLLWIFTGKIKIVAGKIGLFKTTDRIEITHFGHVDSELCSGYSGQWL